MGTLPVLARLRGARGLTQRALANRADLTVETISDLERGATRVPQVGTIAKLARALDMEFDELALLLVHDDGEEAAS